MYIKTAHFPFFFLLLSMPLFGQTTAPSKTYTQDDLRDLSTTNPNFTSAQSFSTRYEGIGGTPFLSEDWQKGAFQLKATDEFGQEVQVRLDLMEQVLYFLLANGQVAVLPSEKLQALRLYTDKEQYRLFRVFPESEIEGSKNAKLKFYEVLYEGAYVLLKHHYKAIRNADQNGALSSQLRKEQYIDQSSLWLQEAGKSFQKVKLKGKSIEQALPDQAGNIQKIIKSENIAL
ncbi:MAG: hypothetical protein KDD04_10960, partial [Sinomicrobium sp.]|nr:hypothetical protein [Sinomicrobium sp.]